MEGGCYFVTKCSRVAGLIHMVDRKFNSFEVNVFMYICLSMIFAMSDPVIVIVACLDIDVHMRT